MEPSRRQTLRAIGRDERYGQALMLLGLTYILGVIGPELLRRASDLIFILILLLMTSHQLVPRRLQVLAYAFAAISGVLTVIRMVSETDLTITLDGLSSMVVVVVTILAVLIRLLHHKEVTASTVMGAFLCYALLGFAAAFLYISVDGASTEPFFAQGPRPEADYTYFSLVTLTTVGFGDLTAGTDLGKRLVVMEALAGQVFLVVLVARLVSLWGAPRRGESNDEGL